MVYQYLFTAPTEYRIIYNYRVAKIERIESEDTILVGDSTLGNTINAELFSQITSTRSVNLALLGIYGYAGSYNMIKKVVAKHQPKNIIIVHTLGMMTRDIAYDGYMYSMSSVNDFFELTYPEKIAFIDTTINIFLSIKNIQSSFQYYVEGETKNLGVVELENDHLKQRGYQIDIDTFYVPSNISINPKKVKFLKKIVAYCQKHQINLIYIHGPILQDIGLHYNIQEINRYIRSTGIVFIDDMFWITPEKIGDTEDHVYPAYKDEYTRLYAEALKPYLK